MSIDFINTFVHDCSLREKLIWTNEGRNFKGIFLDSRFLTRTLHSCLNMMPAVYRFLSLFAVFPFDFLSASPELTQLM